MQGTDVSDTLDDLPPTHRAVEMEDLPALRDLLDAGADIHEERGGLTLLHRAIDMELDAHSLTGEPLHVDMTAYLLARGADPCRRAEGGHGRSARHLAVTCGHWLAACLIDEWIRTHPDAVDLAAAQLATADRVGAAHAAHAAPD